MHIFIHKWVTVIYLNQDKKVMHLSTRSITILQKLKFSSIRLLLWITPDISP